MMANHSDWRLFFFLLMTVIIINVGVFPPSVFAENLLIEEFDGSWQDKSLWYFPDNIGNFLFDSTPGSVRMQSSVATHYSYAINKSPFDSSVSEIKFKFRFVSTNLNFGAGIIISDNPPPGRIDHDANPYSTVIVWPLSSKKFTLATNLCPESNASCNSMSFIKYVDHSDFYEWHEVDVKINDKNQYIIFFDNQESFISSPTTRLPSHIMLGNPEITTNGGVKWPIIEVDYVRVTSGGGGGSVGKTPVVVLPGLGASWDFDAILGGGNGTNWAIPDFVNVYSNLINSLENVGYVRDTDLFIFAYDWRKKLDDLADDLNVYLQNLVTTGKLTADQKVDLIGHSMGGLVARSFLQKHGSGKIEKIITAGSPHLGAIDTYPIWEGATVIGRPWWQKIAIELLAEINRQTGENKVVSIRRLIPGVKDLLPIYDFLVLDGVSKPWSSLLQQNDYLNSIGDVSGIDGITKVMVGTGIDTTKHKISATTRGWREAMAGKWEDGKVVSFITADGDGTVWSGSGLGNFANQQTIGANHSGIISSQEAIANIFSELGLDTSKVLANTSPDVGNSVLAVVLRSPGTLEVCEELVCNSSLGWYFPNHKLFFLPGFSEQKIKVKVLGNTLNQGNYNLYIGKIEDEEEKWKKVEGSLTGPDQKDEYSVDLAKVDLGVSQAGVTSKNSLTVTAGLLEAVKPGWDIGNDVGAVTDEGLDILGRLKAARRIRYSLVEAVKAGAVEPALRVWVALDRFMEGLLADDTYVKADQISRAQQLVPYHKQKTENKLASSSSFYSGEILIKADEQNSLANALASGQETLSLDKLNSARYLYLLSLELRN